VRVCAVAVAATADSMSTTAAALLPQYRVHSTRLCASYKCLFVCSAVYTFVIVQQECLAMMVYQYGHTSN
jgi:hypothetical protein